MNIKERSPAQGYFNDTLQGKHIVGYQGWFTCPRDGNGAGWRHWFGADRPNIDNMQTDMWPDVSELSEGEQCSTGLKSKGGRELSLFSSQNYATIERHLTWMRDYKIDGLALQRFVISLKKDADIQRADKVLQNISEAAQKTGRSYFIMYDISGADAAEVYELILDDWKNIIKSGLTRSQQYWHHGGRPVIGLWGFGFRDRPGESGRAKKLLSDLRVISEGLIVIGGVPSEWRTLSGDSDVDPGWTPYYGSLDFISPWTVGRYKDADSYEPYQKRLAQDYDYLRRKGIGLIPVIFPGFSFGNTKHDPSWFNSIKRNCGKFYAMQGANIVKSNFADAIYTAMFDEVNEGTAIFKVEVNQSNVPRGGDFVGLDSDECSGGSSHYLYLAKNISVQFKESKSHKK